MLLFPPTPLALRAIFGARELDAFLSDKDAVANELAESLRSRAKEHATLMRLRELEVLEKVASAGRMNVVLGEMDLADKVVIFCSHFKALGPGMNPVLRAVFLRFRDLEEQRDTNGLNLACRYVTVGLRVPFP